MFHRILIMKKVPSRQSRSQHDTVHCAVIIKDALSGYRELVHVTFQLTLPGGKRKRKMSGQFEQKKKQQNISRLKQTNSLSPLIWINILA